MRPRRLAGIAMMAAGLLTAAAGGAGLVLADAGRPAAIQTPGPSPSPTPSAEELINEFFAVFGEAFGNGNTAFLFERLHPEVLNLYVESQCRTFLESIRGGRTFEILEIHPPGPWNYGEREGREIIIEEAVQVDLIQRLDGREDRIESHVVIDDGTVRWFTDCGTPV